MARVGQSRCREHDVLDSVRRRIRVDLAGKRLHPRIPGRCRLLGPRCPLQLTAVPLNVNVAFAPGVPETLAPPTGGSGSVATPPPLHAMLLSAWTQPAVKTTSGSVSCKCETTGAGTSKASTTTAFPIDFRVPAARHLDRQRVAAGAQAVHREGRRVDFFRTREQIHLGD